MKPTLVVFARAPAIGVGKRRLAQGVGRVEAWRAYRLLLALTLRRLRDPRWRLVVRLTPDRAAGRFGAEPQGRGDLGARLQRALRTHGRRGPAAVVGTDAPEASAADVWAAFRALRSTGGAIGPATDGGFWLLALSSRRTRRVRLDGVRWSTPHAAADAARALGSLVQVRTLADIDTADDLAAWRAGAVLTRLSWE